VWIVLVYAANAGHQKRSASTARGGKAQSAHRAQSGKRSSVENNKKCRAPLPCPPTAALCAWEVAAAWAAAAAGLQKALSLLDTPRSHTQKFLFKSTAQARIVCTIDNVYEINVYKYNLVFIL
jgi:hypothetical protein